MSDQVSYHLGRFPPDGINWPRLVPLIGTANRALARYDGLIVAIPNATVLLSPLTTQEAVLSSKIEGTNVTMSEVLEPDPECIRNRFGRCVINGLVNVHRWERTVECKQNQSVTIVPLPF